jgi:hypothetical protein
MGNFDVAKRLLKEIVFGVSAGKNTDPGMAGSLLYHMAMVTKMEAETRFLIQEFPETAQPPQEKTERFYADFASDAHSLSKPVLTVNINPKANLTKPWTRPLQRIDRTNQRNQPMPQQKSFRQP